MAAVEAIDLVKRFGSLTALAGLSVRIRRGEVYGLLGPNGAGKTTLIRCLLGLIRPDSGAVRALGHDLPSLEVLAHTGYMTQSAALYPDLTVEENVRFFAAMQGVTDGIDWALDLVELSDRRRSLVAELSGGMRTRCSLACAVVHRPQLLLLDEPTVGVDPHLRQQLWGRLNQMAEAGTTIVVSSHVMDEAERCTRLGLILAGRLLAEGTAQELRDLAGTARLEDAFLRLSEGPPA